MNEKKLMGMLAVVLALMMPVAAETVMSVSVEPGEYWHSKMRVLFFTVKNPPQVAVWVETPEGEFIDTIMITGRTAKQEWRSAPDEGRPESLPVWTHASAQHVGDLDAASSATPEERIDSGRCLSSLVHGARYWIRAEVNHSYDYNDYWEKKAEKGSDRYSGVNGQPSVVYEGELVYTAGEQVVLVPVGQGSVDGSNGTIAGTLDGLTTALSIVDAVRVSVEAE